MAWPAVEETGLPPRRQGLKSRHIHFPGGYLVNVGSFLLADSGPQFTLSECSRTGTFSAAAGLGKVPPGSRELRDAYVNDLPLLQAYLKASPVPERHGERGDSDRGARGKVRLKPPTELYRL